MKGKDKITAIFRDPPPELAFEISESGISMARTKVKGDIRFQPLAAGTIVPSPAHDNMVSAPAFSEALSALYPGNGKRRTAALILPDHSARISVLEFDSFPEKVEEQLGLVRFRLKKSVPFDIDSAAVGFWRQASPGGAKHEVVVAVTPFEVISRYEAPFRAKGLQTGFVTVSSLAALDLVAPEGISVLAKINGQVLSVMVVQQGHLKLIRTLELTSPDLEEIEIDLYPTFVYVEDHFQVRAARLMLCGFGALEPHALRRFHEELGILVEPLRSPIAPVTDRNSGLLGYLQGAAAA